MHSIILINGLCKALSLMIDLAEVLMTALCSVLCRCQRVHFQFQSVMMVILVIAFSPFVSLFPTYWSLFHKWWLVGASPPQKTPSLHCTKKSNLGCENFNSWFLIHMIRPLSCLLYAEIVGKVWISFHLINYKAFP